MDTDVQGDQRWVWVLLKNSVCSYYGSTCQPPNYLFWNICVCVYTSPCVYGGQRTTCRSWFSPFTMQIHPMDWAGVFRAAARWLCLYQLCHLTISKVHFSVEYSFLGTEIHYLPPQCWVTRVPLYTTFRDGNQGTVHVLGKCSTNELHL